MNRHHPYGGYDDAPRRRSASPPYRGGGGGYRGRGARPPRGRGGGAGGYNVNGGPAPVQPAYDAYGTHPLQAAYGGPVSPYTTATPIGSDYSASYGGVGHAQRDPFYANGDASAANYQDYSYGGVNEYNESGMSSRSGGHEERGRGRGAARGGRPRHRDDKVHDSIIEERINRERPCRTLFIRNIKYESSSEEMRAAFEAHGEIKTFFDLIKTRGMVFVTYFDLRAAQRAKERLQGMDVSGRAIDVHYSLPREHELSQRCDREKNQGTILATLVDSRSHQPIDEMELRRRMAQWGEIKHMKPLYVGGIMRPDQRLVEFYDSRVCILAYDRLRDQHMQDGMLDLQFEWDVPEHPLPDGPVPIPIGGGGGGGGGGGRSPAMGYGEHGAYRGGPGSDRDAAPTNEWDRSRDIGQAAFRDDYAGARQNYPAAPDYRSADPRDNRRAGPFPPASPIAERVAPAAYGAAPRGGDFRRDDRGGSGERDFDRDSRGYGGGALARRTSKDEWRGGRPASPVRVRVPPAPGTDEFGRALPPGRPEESPVMAAAQTYPPYGGAAAAATPSAPVTAPQSLDERLEQAKRVQQILAALKPGSTSTATTTPPAPPSAPASQTSAQAPGAYYGASASQASYPSPNQYQASYSAQGLPPNPMSTYPPPVASYPPASQAQGAPASTQNASVQNLLALLAQNQQKN
ncbi:hypothetical protein FRB98_001225 [Tulasnella sp. 332]|nr:hypothetical protein FRB98_001225 [Tulasnella sp. 332]